MTAFLLYLFYPNPGHATYVTMMGLIVLCIALILLSFGIKFWRARVQNAMTKKLSHSWSSASFWFGVVGLVLVVSREEQIQFIAIRFFWVLWFLFLALYVVLQYRVFRSRHYAVLPRAGNVDPRDQYLPGKKR